MLVSSLNDEKNRKEAFIRSGATEPSVGSVERDWAENGWPAETILKRLQEGSRHGRGAPGWSAASGPSGEALLSMEIPGPTGFIQLMLDPNKNEAAFKSAGMLFGPQSLEEAAAALSRSSHQAGERVRASQPAGLRKGQWQGEAPEALAAMSSGLARFHPSAGKDGAISWERDFEAAHAACEAEANPIEAMERVKAQYHGSSEKEMSERMAQEARRGANATVAGEPARLIALGVKGSQLRAAIPLKSDGSVNDHKPIVAILGEEVEGVFKAKGAPLQFYNAEAFARFASSAQSADLGVFPAPRLDENTLSRLEARREQAGVKATQAPAAPKA